MISEEKEETLATRKAKGAKGGGTIRQRPDGRWEARYGLKHKAFSIIQDTL